MAGVLLLYELSDRKGGNGKENTRDIHEIKNM
jgi:hypothetical protein